MRVDVHVEDIEDSGTWRKKMGGEMTLVNISMSWEIGMRKYGTNNKRNQ